MTAVNQKHLTIKGQHTKSINQSNHWKI